MQRRMSHPFTKARRNGESVGKKRGVKKRRLLLHTGFNYSDDDEVDIPAANVRAEKWRPTTHLVDKGQPLTTSPPDSCMGAHQSARLHH